MSLESFFGLEEGESQGSAEAAEKFREQMRKNAKAIKAMTGNQKKQKAKEDKLAKILVKFIQDQSKGDLVFLVVKLLQVNVPGAFILSILSIANAELEAELKAHMKEIKGKKELPGEQGKNNEGQALIEFAGEDRLPEKVKQELNAWGESILDAGLMMPTKTLESVLTPEQKLKSIVLDLIDFSLEEYFQRHGLEMSKEKVRQFALLSIQSVLIKLRQVAKEKTDAEIIETPAGGQEVEIKQTA